jgi:8-oxo-dGTP diphosphatase
MAINGKILMTGMVAANVIYKDEKFLLVQEKKIEAYGLWNLPAGRVEEGYSIEETATKEAKEETGYDVRLIKKIAILQDSAEELVKHVFQSEIIGGDLDVPEDEILDAKWFSLEEIRTMQGKLRNPWVLQSIEIFVTIAQ